MNQFNDTFTYTNSFRNQYFTANQSDLRERKEKITKLFVGSYEDTDPAKNQSYYGIRYRALWEKKIIT